MAHILDADRVREVSTTTGTGTLSLGGAPDTYLGFVPAVGSGNTCDYVIVHQGADEWETGVGTVTDGSPDTLARTYPKNGSAGLATLVDFSAGTKDVFISLRSGQIRDPLRLAELDSPPNVASPYDDEFRTAALDGKWTVITGPDNLVIDPNYKGDFLQAQCPGVGSGQTWVARQAMAGVEGAAGTAVSIMAKISLSAYTGLCIVDLGVGDDSGFAGGNYFLFGIKNDSGSFVCTFYDGSESTQSLGPFGGTIYIRVQRTAANVVSVYASLDGFAWRRFYTGTKTFDMDYMFIRLFGSVGSGEASMNLVDWVRVNDNRIQINGV